MIRDISKGRGLCCFVQSLSFTNHERNIFVFEFFLLSIFQHVNMSSYQASKVLQDILHKTICKIAFMYILQENILLTQCGPVP